MNRVLVFGATGNVGRQVVSQLMPTGVLIRAVTRHPDVAALPPQVEVLGGDLRFPETLDRSLSGADTIFLVWTAPPDAIAPALDRILRHARRIVFLSAPIKTAHPLFQQPNPLRAMFEQIEERIVTSGLEWTFLRPGMFAANALGWWASQIQLGDSVRWPYAQLPAAPIHEADIAAVAVRALCENGHGGSEYVLTGPQPLTHAQQVFTIGQAIGRPLRMEEVSPEEWRRECVPNWPPMAVKMMLDAWAAAMGHPAHLTATVSEVTGVPARTFLDWATEHAAQF